jgi:hypothetical protein
MTFSVLAVSYSEYKEQISLTGISENFMDDTDYRLLISSKYFEEFIKEETESPLIVKIFMDDEDGAIYREVVCGSVGILDNNVLGDDFIVMPNEYFRKLQIETFTTVKIEKVRDIKKINYIKIKGHDERYTSWDGINEILEAHLNNFRAISSGQTTNVLGINFTIVEMKDCDGNIITYGSLYETDVNIEFDELNTKTKTKIETVEEILKDNERVYIDENGESIKYNADNIIENLKHKHFKHFDWRLTFD